MLPCWAAAHLENRQQQPPEQQTHPTCGRSSSFLFHTKTELEVAFILSELSETYYPTTTTTTTTTVSEHPPVPVLRVLVGDQPPSSACKSDIPRYNNNNKPPPPIIITNKTTTTTRPKTVAIQNNKRKRTKNMRRDSETNDSAGGGIEDGKEKSERKRQREKQRRSELTNAFDDLAALVLMIDTDEDETDTSADMGAKKKSRRLSSRSEGADEAGGMTRVDLVNRALTIMKKLRQENRELKESLSRSGGREKNEVMVMVPTLTPADEAGRPPGPAPSSFRPPYMQPGSAPLPPQDHSQPPMYGSTPSRYPPPPPQGPQGGWAYHGGAGQNHYSGPPGW